MGRKDGYIKKAIYVHNLIEKKQFQKTDEAQHVEGICPYYIGEYDNVILCKKAEDSTGLCLAFPEEERKDLYKLKICSDGWEQCLLAKMQKGEYN